jgi:hypothetical protein
VVVGPCDRVSLRSLNLGGAPYGDPLLQVNKAFVAGLERRVPTRGPSNYLVGKSEKLLVRFIYTYNKCSLISQAVETSWTA